MFEIATRMGDRPISRSTIIDTIVLRPLSTLTGLLARIKHEIWLRNQIAKALALDDRILADIAVSRREIKHAVRGGISVLEKRVQD
jgi:uncharacterized protein YjiS (DUF1127 family)